MEQVAERGSYIVVRRVYDPNDGFNKMNEGVHATANIHRKMIIFGMNFITLCEQKKNQQHPGNVFHA